MLYLVLLYKFNLLLFKKAYVYKVYFFYLLSHTYTYLYKNQESILIEIS